MIGDHMASLWVGKAEEKKKNVIRRSQHPVGASGMIFDVYHITTTGFMSVPLPYRQPLLEMVDLPMHLPIKPNGKTAEVRGILQPSFGIVLPSVSLVRWYSRCATACFS